MKKLSSKLKHIELFDVVNILILMLVCFLCLFPVLHIAAKSLSGVNAVTSGRVGLIPVDFQIGTYKYVAMQKNFWNSFIVTIVLTLMGTAGGLFFSALTAYPLSRKDFRGRKVFMGLFIFAWLFVPPLVPMYLTMKTYGLIDSLVGLVLMDLVIAYNMLIVKVFFEGLPDSLTEAAVVDGATDFGILFKIVLPLSVPVMATAGIMYAFYYWNMYVSPRIYLNSLSQQPMQLYLYNVMVSSMQEQPNQMQLARIYSNVQPDTVRSATVVLSMIPILCIYPFLQRYYVKGMLLGSVKG